MDATVTQITSNCLPLNDDSCGFSVDIEMRDDRPTDGFHFYLEGLIPFACSSSSDPGGTVPTVYITYPYMNTDLNFKFNNNNSNANGQIFYLSLNGSTTGETNTVSGSSDAFCLLKNNQWTQWINIGNPEGDSIRPGNLGNISFRIRKGYNQGVDAPLPPNYINNSDYIYSFNNSTDNLIWINPYNLSGQTKSSSTNLISSSKYHNN